MCVKVLKSGELWLGSPESTQKNTFTFGLYLGSGDGELWVLKSVVVALGIAGAKQAMVMTIFILSFHEWIWKISYIYRNIYNWWYIKIYVF